MSTDRIVGLAFGRYVVTTAGPEPEPGRGGQAQEPEPTPYEVWLSDDPQATWDDPALRGPADRQPAPAPEPAPGPAPELEF